jgi:hypothetical protein
MAGVGLFLQMHCHSHSHNHGHVQVQGEDCWVVWSLTMQGVRPATAASSITYTCIIISVLIFKKSVLNLNINLLGFSQSDEGILRLGTDLLLSANGRLDTAILVRAGVCTMLKFWLFVLWFLCRSRKIKSMQS